MRAEMSSAAALLWAAWLGSEAACWPGEPSRWVEAGLREPELVLEMLTGDALGEGVLRAGLLTPGAPCGASGWSAAAGRAGTCSAHRLRCCSGLTLQAAEPSPASGFGTPGLALRVPQPT